MKKIFLLIILLALILNTVYAQTVEIKLNHIGFGSSSEEVYFTVHNTGQNKVSTVNFYVDGKLTKSIEGVLSPKKGFRTVLFIKPGEHLVEVKTPEGAYDSLNITILATKEKTTIQPGENLIYLKENKMWIGTITLIIILVIGTWLLTKKPKLKF